MRKVLLATTALVAITGVTAANADISISGNIEAEYLTVDGSDATFTTDGQLKVDATNTADSGVTYAVGWAMKMENTDGTDLIDHYYASMSSADMGTVYMGDINDSAPGLLDGALGRNMDIESENMTADTDTQLQSAAANDMVTYVSPTMGGLTVAVSADPNADNTSFGLRYNMSNFQVYFGSFEDQQNMGASTSIAGLSIGVGSRKTDGTTQKASDLAVKYALADGITVSALTAKGTDSDGATHKYSNVGAKYTIAPGVAAKIESGKDESAGYTYVSFDVNF